jgi:hypothetical protein
MHYSARDNLAYPHFTHASTTQQELSTLTPSMMFTLQPSCMHNTTNEWMSKPMSHQQLNAQHILWARLRPRLMSCHTQPKKQRSMSLKIGFPGCARGSHISYDLWLACSCRWGPETLSITFSYVRLTLRGHVWYTSHILWGWLSENTLVTRTTLSRTLCSSVLSIDWFVCVWKIGIPRCIIMVKIQK